MQAIDGDTEELENDNFVLVHADNEELGRYSESYFTWVNCFVFFFFLLITSREWNQSCI